MDHGHYKINTENHREADFFIGSKNCIYEQILLFKHSINYNNRSIIEQGTNIIANIYIRHLNICMI